MLSLQFWGWYSGEPEKKADWGAPDWINLWFSLTPTQDSWAQRDIKNRGPGNLLSTGPLSFESRNRLQHRGQRPSLRAFIASAWPTPCLCPRLGPTFFLVSYPLFILPVRGLCLGAFRPRIRTDDNCPCHLAFQKQYLDYFCLWFSLFLSSNSQRVMLRRMGVGKKRLPLQRLKPIVRGGQEGCGVRPAVSFVFLI